MSRWLDIYRREWPRIAAVQAIALGGASLLAGRKSQTNVRALAVMNGMTMCAHQYEEYVDPGWFPGMVNVGLFKSDQPRNWPYNPNSAMCANFPFRWIYIPPMLFPQVKWLGLPGALLGIAQGVLHSTVIPRAAKSPYPFYSPGALTGALLHIPIGITYIGALRAQGGISRSDWVKTAGVLLGWAIIGVGVPNVALASKSTPYEFTDRQMGPYKPQAPESEESSTKNAG